MIRIGRSPLTLVLLGLTALLLAGCGGEPALSPSQVGLPHAVHPQTLASATYSTSPDGGIYVNPDPIQVVLVGRFPMEPLAQRLGADGQWGPLRDLGELTAVGFQLKNSGLAGSDPQLNSLQVAADLAPAGISSATRDRFYYPAYPLAALSTVSLDGQCTVHVDPGQTITVVLVYPPVRSTSYVTWGEYGDFAIAVPVGGAVPVSGALHAGICAPPSVQPS